MSGSTVNSECTTGVWSDATMLSGLKAAASAGSNVLAATSDDGSAYAVEATLKTDTNTSWCVDSAGKSLQEANGAESVTACP